MLINYMVLGIMRMSDLEVDGSEPEVKITSNYGPDERNKFLDHSALFRGGGNKTITADLFNFSYIGRFKIRPCEMVS